MISNYQIMNESYLANKNNISIIEKDKHIKIEFGDTKYLNKSLDLSVVEIKKNKLNSLKFLELDDCLYENDSETLYYKETMYIIHNNSQKNNCVSIGIINNINKHELICSCNIDTNSDGSPIFNSTNNKIIGVYKNNVKYYAKGIFFKFIVNEFIKEYMFFLKRNKIQLQL